MAVDDLWYLSKKDAGGKRQPSKSHGRGKRWRVRFVDDMGQPRRRCFERRSDAEAFDVDVRSSVNHGTYVDLDAGKVTVRSYGEAWRKNRLHRDSTEERVERALRLHVYPLIGDLRMAQVRHSHIQSWVKDRARVLEPSTLKVLYSVLVSVFNTAVVDRVIGVSPCAGNIALPDVAKTDLWVPTASQVRALSHAFAGKGRQGLYEAMPEVAAGTGLRQGEIWGLELEHVNFLRREITVAQQLKVVLGRKPFLAPPKTSTSARLVQIGAVVAEALARHIEAFPPAEVDIEDETDPRKPVRRKAKLIFLNGHGEPISRQSWSHTWAPGVARAGLPKGTGFHALRHFYATTLIHGGAGVKTVQLALGHTTPMITLNTYVGHWPDAVDTTRALIDAALRPPARFARAV